MLKIIETGEAIEACIPAIEDISRLIKLELEEEDKPDPIIDANEENQTRK